MADPKYWIAGKRSAEVSASDIAKVVKVAKAAAVDKEADAAGTDADIIDAIRDCLIANGLMKSS